MCGGHDRSHSWLMLLGCAVPLLMIFILPLLGVREGWVIPIALLAMLLCHLVVAAVASPSATSDLGSGDSNAHH